MIGASIAKHKTPSGFLETLQNVADFADVAKIAFEYLPLLGVI